MSKINVAGVEIDNLSKREVIEEIHRICRSAYAKASAESSVKSGYIVTPYSELIVFALKNSEYRKILNQAALALPDGIGILWAAKYLSSPSVGLFRSLFAIIFHPQYIRSIIHERVTGSQLIYDIAKLAAENNYSISLIGGSGNVAEEAGRKLKQLYPNLNVKLALSDRAFDGKVAQEIAASNSDILLIAYSPPKQEVWLAENINQLNVKVAMGLGGTFDYVAGKHSVAPRIIKGFGLEWFWRLITQPRRIKRIWNAVPVFVWKIYCYKHESLFHHRQ